VTEAATKVLRLTIEFPDFYIEDIDQDGDEFEYDSLEMQVEESMHLESNDVIVVFQGYEGDSPGTVLRSLEGRIREFQVRSV
jgi:hypothetical protein